MKVKVTKRNWYTGKDMVVRYIIWKDNKHYKEYNHDEVISFLRGLGVRDIEV